MIALCTISAFEYFLIVCLVICVYVSFVLKDCQVFIWTMDYESGGHGWTPKLLHKFNDVVWHLSWSVTGNILAVSGGDNKVCKNDQLLFNAFSRGSDCNLTLNWFIMYQSRHGT